MKTIAIRNIGNMRISEAFPFLDWIAITHGLNLSFAKDFKIARNILVNLTFKN